MCNCTSGNDGSRHSAFSVELICLPSPPSPSPALQTPRVNGYDMAYLDVGNGPPLVCVHGSLCDFRIWSAVLGPLTQKHRLIAVSLRHFFPEQWDGVGDGYSIAQHVDDMIALNNVPAILTPMGVRRDDKWRQSGSLDPAGPRHVSAAVMASLRKTGSPEAACVRDRRQIRGDIRPAAPRRHVPARRHRVS
jgi:hypothetical protein